MAAAQAATITNSPASNQRGVGRLGCFFRSASAAPGEISFSRSSRTGLVQRGATTVERGRSSLCGLRLAHGALRVGADLAIDAMSSTTEELRAARQQCARRVWTPEAPAAKVRTRASGPRAAGPAARPWNSGAATGARLAFTPFFTPFG